MAAKVKKKTRADKWKKKTWYTIYAPDSFNRKEIAKTVASKPELVKGRVLTVSARDVANQARKQYIMLRFKVMEVSGDKAYTKLVGHEIRESYLKRMARRRASKIHTVQDALTKDGVKVRVKTITITDRKARRIQETGISKVQKEQIAAFCKERDSDSIIGELIFGNPGEGVAKAAKKIFPVKRVEIAKSKLLAK